ncbi:MAG: hypothetical protein QNJ51_28840 [Calothrix sp. MO_167.B12]|nr:hypothetical protein [Calothrix sp. MO_167.B12]
MIFEMYLEVHQVGYSTVDEIDGPGPDKKGMLIQFTHMQRWDGFHKKWFLIPEAHQAQMLEMAIAAIASHKKLAVGIEYPGKYDQIKSLPYPEIKSMFLTNLDGYNF